MVGVWCHSPFCFACIKIGDKCVCEKAVSSEVRIDKHHLIAEYAPTCSLFCSWLVRVQSCIICFLLDSIPNDIKY